MRTVICSADGERDGVIIISYCPQWLTILYRMPSKEHSSVAHIGDLALM